MSKQFIRKFSYLRINLIQSSCFIFIVSDGKKCAHFSPLLSFCALIFQNDSRKCYHFNIPRVLGDFPLTRCVRDLRRLLCVSSSRPPRTLLNTTAKLVPITALISLPNTFPITTFYYLYPLFSIHVTLSC